MRRFIFNFSNEPFPGGSQIRLGGLLNKDELHEGAWMSRWGDYVAGNNKEQNSNYLVALKGVGNNHAIKNVTHVPVAVEMTLLATHGDPSINDFYKGDKQ